MSKMFRPLWRYADFAGRSDRGEFWSFLGLSAGVFILTMVAVPVAFERADSGKSGGLPAGVSLYLLWWLATAVPWLALQVRRFHDQGRSGWWVLINLSAYPAVAIHPLAGAALYAISMILMALPSAIVKASTVATSLGSEISEIGSATNPMASSLTLQVMPDASSEEHKDIRRTADGRFSTGGYSFATFEQAKAFSQRRHNPKANRYSESTMTPSTGACTTDDPDVMQTLDGRFTSGGYSFSTFEQARAYAVRCRNPGPSNAPSQIEPPARSSPTFQHTPTVPMPSPVEVPAKTDDPDVSLRADGRFASGGYAFASFEQAQKFASRRRDTGTANSSTIRSPAGARPPRVIALRDERSDIASSVVPSRSTGSGRMAQAVAAKWIGSPTPVTVGDVTFDADLLYFGTPYSQHGPHRALVDPNLVLSGTHSDRAGTSLDYWPNYAELRPEARRAYLEWLAGGRRDPATPIGYVFIYFYGLERRLIAEQSAVDATPIINELRELIAVYGENYSFAGYARRLLDAAEIIHDLAPETLRASLDLRLGWEIPLNVRIALGRKIRDGVPIDAEEALCWALCHPQLYPRTAVRRCFDEFRTLWHHQYTERFPNGIKVRVPKSRLNFHYRAASSEFNANAPIGDVPDIGSISGPLSKLEELLNDCSEALDPLSRFLGRNPEQQGTVLATALAPAPVRESSETSAFALARADLLSPIIDGGFHPTSIRALLDVVMKDAGADDAERRKSHMKRLPDILDAMRIGFEPDKRFGPSVTLAEDMSLCLFELDAPPPTAVSAIYAVARTMVEVSLLAAQADKLVVDAELRSIVADLAVIAELTPPERKRLEAHMHALTQNPPKLSTATKRLLALGEEEKDLVLRSVVGAILADQRVTPAEVRFLEGLYKLLGKPQDEVYSRLHSGTSPPTRKAVEKVRRDADDVLDSAKLARIREETQAVSTMLASIFKEDEAIATALAPGLVKDAAMTIDGLDAAHSRLLIALAERPLEAEAFEALCRADKLFPGGAIETINDWAFDIFDDAVVEEDDLLCIKPQFIENIRAMSEPA